MAHLQQIQAIEKPLRPLQGEKGVNTEGALDVAPTAFEELVVNMFVHRDYFILAPWRVFIFDNRIEIVSPGHLPDNLTVEKIRLGNSIIRNPILVSYACLLYTSPSPRDRS